MSRIVDLILINWTKIMGTEQLFRQIPLIISFSYGDCGDRNTKQKMKIHIQKLEIYIYIL